MPYSPLISKIRCHNPNRKSSSYANKNYLTYIATREGVDISLVNDINDILKNERILKSELNEGYLYKEADNEKYLEYMAFRPRSHGLFGNIDTSDMNQVAKEVGKLTKQGKCIYRGIISLSQKDAEALGFTNKKSWNTYLENVMPDIANSLGISMTNFTWVAAFHAEKTHPHIHFEMWDNTNKVKSSYIHVSKQHEIRKILSEAAFDNEYEKMIKEIYKVERAELNKIRNQSRTKLTDITKDIMNSIDFVPGMKVTSLPNRISRDEVEEISHELERLVNILPTSGSIDYKYLPIEVKEQVNKISSMFLTRVDMKKELNKYLNAIEEGQQIVGKTKFDIKIARDNAKKDIYKRIGNIISKKAKQLKIYQDRTYSEMEEVIKELDDKNDSTIEKRLEVTPQNDSFNSDFDLFIDQFTREKVEVSGKYYYKWNHNYKKALDYLYNVEVQDFDKAYELLKKEADSNNVLAIHDLGKIYEQGIGKKIDLNKASEYYLKAFQGFNQIEKEKPNKDIEYRIGKLYDSGKGVEQNYFKAIKWYQAAVNQNHKGAQYALAKIYISLEEPEKIDKGIKMLEKLAEEEHDMAQYSLGKIYADREAGKYDIEKAIPWFNKSASHGNQFAQYQIGKRYLWGKEVPKDEELGKYWLNKSKEQGNKYAKKALENYEEYIVQIVPGVTYDLVKTAFNMLTQENQRQSSWNVDKVYRSRSKQAIKEEALRQRIQGKKYDYEEEREE